MPFILIVFLATTPLVLLFGWLQYFKLPARADWRTRASLVGLSAPLASIAIWILAVFIGQFAANSAVRLLISDIKIAGVCVPLVGLVVGFAGRPRLILAIVPTCLAAMLFWYVTTMP